MAKGENDAVNEWSYFLIPLLHLLTAPLRVRSCLHFWKMTFLETNAKLLVNITICYCAGLLRLLFWRWLLQGVLLLSHLSVCFLLPMWARRDKRVTPQTTRLSPGVLLQLSPLGLVPSAIKTLQCITLRFYRCNTGFTDSHQSAQKYLYIDTKDYKVYKYSQTATKIYWFVDTCVLFLDPQPLLDE